MEHQGNKLTFKRLGIYTQQEHFVYMREDCHVCISEGFEALTRIRITCRNKSIVASLNVFRTDLLKKGEISLSENAIQALGIKDGDQVTVSHMFPINSLSYVRSKIYGNTLSAAEINEIVQDIANGNYSNVQLSAFITACAGNRMLTDEIIFLTKAMINSGQHIQWNKVLPHGKAGMIVDKHCIGGLPGNRTSPIIVSIVTSFGLTMPKTSSRAITSPAGTADAMEVITNVNLSLNQIKKVVNKEGGCIAWGGLAKLSPVDDILIKVEKALDIDSQGQLIASVLSKKVVAGSNRVIIDIPVGETAKLRSIEAANDLKVEMEKVAHVVGLKLKVVLTDGTQPVGRGIGPALEARDILAVLRNESNAPLDLKERALLLAGELLELSGKVDYGDGNEKARYILESGQAYQKFKSICDAQGRFDEPRMSKYQQEIKAEKEGTVIKVDNRKLAKIAKLAGAPDDKASGVDFLTPLGSKIKKGQTLYVIHAESEGELAYALEYHHSQKEILTIV